MTTLPVLLRGGPLNGWAYAATEWAERTSSVRLQRSRGQNVTTEVLHYADAKTIDTLPSGDPAQVWRWQGDAPHSAPPQPPSRPRDTPDLPSRASEDSAPYPPSGDA